MIWFFIILIVMAGYFNLIDEFELSGYFAIAAVLYLFLSLWDAF